VFDANYMTREGAECKVEAYRQPLEMFEIMRFFRLAGVMRCIRFEHILPKSA